eukprot:gene15400-biopygen4964
MGLNLDAKGLPLVRGESVKDSRRGDVYTYRVL